jgi:hypothetical protein
MRAVLVDFATPAEAYAFVSEIRRRADTMLWDVRVRREANRAVVVVPERTWRADAFVRAVAMSSGGVVREDDRVRDRARHRPGSRP